MNVFERGVTTARLYQAFYFDFTALLTVCTHGLGATGNISSSLCKYS